MYSTTNKLNEVIACDNKFIPPANVDALPTTSDVRSSVIPTPISVMIEIFATSLPAKMPSSFVFLFILVESDNASYCCCNSSLSCITYLEAVGAPITLASTAQGSSIKWFIDISCHLLYIIFGHFTYLLCQENRTISHELR